MAKRGVKRIDFTPIELDGVRYVILREAAFRKLCDAAGVPAAEPMAGDPLLAAAVDSGSESLANKLIRRRQVAGLTQAELARRAGIRPETLNRIERGRTTPDFATIRKLVNAMDAAEQQQNGE